MDTVRRYSLLIDGAWVGTDDQIEAGTVWVNEEKFVHLDQPGQLDRRAYALLLGTPPA
jgi:hypothetical protein